MFGCCCYRVGKPGRSGESGGSVRYLRLSEKIIRGKKNAERRKSWDCFLLFTSVLNTAVTQNWFYMGDFAAIFLSVSIHY